MVPRVAWIGKNPQEQRARTHACGNLTWTLLTQRGSSYNTLYGSLVLLEPSERDAVQRLLRMPDLPPGSAPLLRSLRDLKFLVEDQLDEFDLISQRKSVGVHQGNNLDVILMPTLDCNFGCRLLLRE